jgi:hypothetical protein
MLPLSALFAGKSRECRQVGKAPLTVLGSLVGLCQQGNALIHPMAIAFS